MNSAERQITTTIPYGMFSADLPKQGPIAIHDSDGQPLVTIHTEDDGRLEYGPNYDPDEAARIFWDALRRQCGLFQPASQVTDPIRRFVQGLLKVELADEEARKGLIREYEKTGHRIVDGGQTDRLPDGESTWEITDWRTGDVIASGIGGPEDCSAAIDRLDPAGRWMHIDNISGANLGSDPDMTGLEPADIPESLANSLHEWVSMIATSDEDIAEVVGWSVEEVARHRE